MLYRLSCPSCGKSIRVGDADGGRVLLCAACGQRVTIPPGLGAPGELVPLHQVETAASTEMMQIDEVGEPVVEDTAAIDQPFGTESRKAVPSPSQPTSASFASPRRALPGSYIAAFISMVIVTLGVALVVGYQSAGNGTPPEPLQSEIAANEAANTDLLKLKSEAEALTGSGQMREAHAKYRELSMLAARRSITSPKLLAKIDRAKLDQDRVYWLLMAQMERAQQARGGVPASQPGSAPFESAAPLP